jgi:hypothetical protein
MGEPTPQQEFEAEHRAMLRVLTGRAHNVNLDIGTDLMYKLAVVDPKDMDVARFFAYGLLGPDTNGYLGNEEHTARKIAASGIRLVFDAHRTTTTPTLKNGQPGKTKIAYGDIEDATKWLWKFIDGAKNAGELYGCTLIAFAAQHYAHDLALPVVKGTPRWCRSRATGRPARHSSVSPKRSPRLLQAAATSP